MFGKYQNVFRSRWRAVVWSVGICLTAYCAVPSEEEGADGGLLIEAGRAAAEKVAADEAAPEHRNPWALRPDR